MTTTPSVTFHDETIPAVLKAFDHWAIWTPTPKQTGTGFDKAPRQADGSMAKSNDPATWCDYTTAVMAAHARDSYGVGFMVSRDAGIVGGDLDHCRNPETGAIKPWALSIVTALHTYTEVSPSGTGLRFFAYGTLPAGKRKKGPIEVYDDLRFLTVTGDHLDGTPRTLEDRTEELAAVHSMYLADPAPRPAPPALNGSRVGALADDEIVQKCRSARNADKFEALWRGDVSAHPSHSEADLDLVGMLRFYTQDATQLDRLFRESGLMRKKWDERRGAQTYGERTIAAALQHVTETYTGTSAARELEKGVHMETATESVEIISLDAPQLPEWPTDLFPTWLQDYVNAVAAHTETPIELPAMMGLSVLSTACQKTFRVCPRAGYSEPLNLWTQSALDSGNRKSAVLSDMTRPLLDIERERGKAAQTRIAELQSQRDTMQARVKALRTRAAAAEEGEADHLTKEILNLELSLPTVPTAPRLWAQDITPEKLAVMMADNGEKMTILSAEGGLFDMMAGRYSNGVPNLDLYLQAHSGDSVHVDRKNGPPIFLRAPALTIGLSAQPDVLRSLAKREGFRGRGLLARFLYVLPASRLGYRSLTAHPIPPAVETAYHRHIRALLGHTPPVNEHGEEDPYMLVFTDPARAEWEDFARQAETGLRDGGRYEQIKDWIGKLPGHAARIAGCVHCAEHATGQPWRDPISLDTMKRVLDAAAVLIEHALAVFDLMGAAPTLNAARKVWSWVEREHCRTFTARDCHRALRGTFTHVAELLPAFTVLVERGHLLEPTGPPRTEAGRPSRVFVVNPILTERW